MQSKVFHMPVKQQLQMIWPRNYTCVPLEFPLPPGYLLRTWQPGDNQPYIDLMHRSGFTDWGDERLEQTHKLSLPYGIFFIVHQTTDKLVATACSQHNPIDLHPGGGELGWVAADPAHRGKKLGYYVCAAALKRFLRAGFQDIFLRTDDFRLAAIKTYLNLGFRPFLHTPDMSTRWQKLCSQLGVTYDSLHVITHNTA
jgi:mycothiol synthase